MTLSSRPLSRRTTLAAAPLLLAAGCRWGPPDETNPSATSHPRATVEEPASDDDQVMAASTAIRATEAFVSATSAAHVGLSTPLATLLTLHTEHLALLEATGDVETPQPPVPARSGAALTAVRRRERALQETLVTLATEVSSGTLARTLASMAAGVAQHLRRLPASVKERDA